MLKISGKSICKNFSKSLSGKYSPGMLATCQKPLDHAKQSATDVFKTAWKGAIQKTAKATGDLIGNKISNKITKVSKNSDQNNSETVTYEYDKEIPRERYISSEKREEIFDDLKLK